MYEIFSKYHKNYSSHIKNLISNKNSKKIKERVLDDICKDESIPDLCSSYKQRNKSYDRNSVLNGDLLVIKFMNTLFNIKVNDINNYRELNFMIIKGIYLIIF